MSQNVLCSSKFVQLPKMNELQWTWRIDCEQGLATHKTFQKQVNNVFETIKRMGNPFLDDFPELVTLHNCNCVAESVTLALGTLEETGIKQYQD